MFNFLKRKKKDAGQEAAAVKEAVSPGSEGQTAEGANPAPETPAEPAPAAPAANSGGDANASASVTKLSTEIEKLKAGQTAFQEVRKGFSERFNRTSEQIGELRGMILDRDRVIQELELKTVKAADLVESVHPEKLMIEVQKEDAKIEALKANLEGNEAIMDRIMSDLKDMRKKVEFVRGVEEIVKLSEEVKKELVEVKKVEAQIKINADKVQTIYMEMRKRFQDVDMFKSTLDESKATLAQSSKDIDFLKNKIGDFVEKTEVEKLMTKVQSFITALKELEKKSSLTKDIEQLKTILEGLK